MTRVANPVLGWALIGAQIMLGGCAFDHPGPNEFEGSVLVKPASGAPVFHAKKTGIVIQGSDPSANGLPTIIFGSVEIDFGVVPASGGQCTATPVHIESKVDATTGVHTGDVFQIGTP